MSKKSEIFGYPQHLSNLRDWLLPMLMNGQVKVGSGAERNAGYDMEEGKWVVEPK